MARTTGLLRHLVMEIISTDDHAAGSLQTAFDLLGELLKGNIEVAPNTPCSFPHAPRPVLRRSSDDLTVCMCVSLSVVPQLHISFVEMLSQTQFMKFMDVVMNQLVDSNVFLRALLLTLENQGLLLAPDVETEAGRGTGPNSSAAIEPHDPPSPPSATTLACGENSSCIDEAAAAEAAAAEGSQVNVGRPWRSNPSIPARYLGQSWREASLVPVMPTSAAMSAASVSLEALESPDSPDSSQKSPEISVPAAPQSPEPRHAVSGPVRPQVDTLLHLQCSLD